MYLSWNEKTLTKFDDKSVEQAYDNGFVFTRKGRGVMNQTRSLRIDLSKFELSSENKRVLKKTEDLILSASPIPYAEYDWNIHKMGKEFYEKKIGEKMFSAQKIKELITDKNKSNFNKLFVYILSLRGGRFASADAAIPGLALPSDGIASPRLSGTRNDSVVGYCITLETGNILHYCYPFYNLQPTTYNLQPNTGMGMMLKAIIWAKNNNKKYVYLGSFQRPTDTYKLQFSGLEWFDGNEWERDLNKLKLLDIRY